MEKKIIKILGRTNLSGMQIQKIAKYCNLQVFKNDPISEAETISRIDNADVIVVNTLIPITENVLRACRSVKYIVTLSSGVNHIDINFCRRHKIKVTNFPSYCSRTVAEKTMAFILVAIDNIVSALKNFQNKRWDHKWEFLSFVGRELYGKTLCLLGYGHIGRMVEKLAQAFGIKVLCVNSKTPLAKIKKYLKSADVVSLHMDLNKNTQNYLDKSKLSLLKPTVVIINSARGKLINESDLYNFLQKNKKAAAFLDVLAVEPPPEDHCFRNLPNIYVTPHIAWNSQEASQRLADMACDAIIKSIKQK